MHKLVFGRRARRKARLKRLALPAWLLSLAAVALGVPGAADLDLLHRLGDPRSVAAIHAATDPPQSGHIESSESTAAALQFRRATFATRPEPDPSPSETATTTASAPPGSLTEIIYSAAAEFGIDGSYLLGIAHCESTLDPAAYNPAGYHGLFQYDATTWGAYGYGSIWDPVAQARTTARLLAAGQASRWPSCA